MLTMFQSTRPRGARPAWRRENAPKCKVSIHAPAWGATAGATMSEAPTSRFNPRARVGRDLGTPADPLRLDTFQSTRPRGARHVDWGPWVEPYGFQSTRPRGARLRVACRSGLLPCFNPRARVGRDAVLYSAGRRQSGFQSTRPRGARRVSSAGEAGARSFQSTRPRGARQNTPAACLLDILFQSTRPRGARRPAFRS